MDIVDFIISELEKYVADSQTVLIYATDGYFVWRDWGLEP